MNTQFKRFQETPETHLITCFCQFHPEDGGDMVLRSVELSRELHTGRYNPEDFMRQSNDTFLCGRRREEKRREEKSRVGK
jgi:hypothetical protein